jgi:pimeloyl-ACP methyl ester carboxylesterase
MGACTIKGEYPVHAQTPGLCGTLKVPEDRSNLNGRQIGLRVAVVPAAVDNPEPDPLFVLAGGPGDAGTQFFAWLPGLFKEVHATRDIVLIDQRETGNSNPLMLPPMPETKGLSKVDANAMLSSWTAKSLAGIDADPRFYTTSVAANDIDDVRVALGYEAIDLYGTSYGGTLAQYYLRQHGENVRSEVPEMIDDLVACPAVLNAQDGTVTCLRKPHGLRGAGSIPRPVNSDDPHQGAS